MKKLFLPAVLLVAAFGFADNQYDRDQIRGRHDFQDQLWLGTQAAFAGLWTCASGSDLCTGTVATTTTTAALTAGDKVVLLASDSKYHSYEVASVVDDDNFRRLRWVSSTTEDELLGVTASTMWEINSGLPASTPADIYDGAGTITPLALSGQEVQIGHAGLDGKLDIYSEQGATDYMVTFGPAATMTQNTVYTWPVDDGTASQFLQTDGSGALTWATVAEADTLATVTGRGATTTTSVELQGGLVIGSNDTIGTSSTTTVGGTVDLFLSRYDPVTAGPAWEVDADSGVASDGTGTGTMLLGAGSVTNPSVGLGTGGNTGIYESSNGVLAFSGEGVQSWRVGFATSVPYIVSNAGSNVYLNGTSSNLIPALAPLGGTPGTGFGGTGTYASQIVGGVEITRANATGLSVTGTVTATVPVYGEMLLNTPGVGLSMTTTATFYPMHTAVTGDVAGAGYVTFTGGGEGTGDSLTIGASGAGTYFVSHTGSEYVSAGCAGGCIITCCVFKEGVNTELCWERTLSTAANIGVTATSGIVTAAANDDFTLQCATNGTGDTLTFERMSLVLTRLN